MKVAVFLTYNYSLGTWYNSRTLDRELKIYKLLHDNFNIDFIFFSYSNDSDKQYLNNYPEFDLVSLNNKYKNKIFRFISSLKIDKKILNEVKKCDIIHQHQLLGSWVSILYKRKAQKPLLIRTGYDMYEFSKLNNEPLFKRIFLSMLTKLSLRFSDTYTVASKSDKKLINSMNSRYNSKIKVRPNWIVDNLQKQLSDRDFYKILSVGRLENQKNFTHLIRFFDKNSKFMLKIIGEGKNKTELLKIIKNNNLRVEIESNVDNELLIKEMNKYVFYISSSTFEGNPKTVLEAMSAGCVVIASNIKNHEELIEHEKTGILFDLHSSDLHKVLNTLSNNFENLSALSSNSRNFVIENNHIDKLAKNMNKDYLELF